MSDQSPSIVDLARSEVLANQSIVDASKQHFVVLDGLRGLAILLVMVYHFCLPHEQFHSRESGFLLQAAQAGWMGVDLFFVLSGFLITGILVGTRTKQGYFKNFLARRFLRIWPLYYLNLLGLLVILPIAIPVSNELQSMRDEQVWFWLYAANWLFAVQGGFEQTSGGYLWSLAVEEQFYLIWPFVVYALSERSLLRLSLLLLCVSLISRVALVHFGVSTTGSVYVMTFTRLDGLVVGSCLALCLRSKELTTYLTRVVPVAAVVGLIGLVAVRIADRDFFFWSKYMAMYGYTFVAILFGAVVAYLLGGGAASVLRRAFSNRFMTQTGKYSYALYMVHVPVASALFPLTRGAFNRLLPSVDYNVVFMIFFCAAFAVSWILAVASWNLFEKRILALKRYFTFPDSDRAEPKAVAVPN